MDFMSNLRCSTLCALVEKAIQTYTFDVTKPRVQDTFMQSFCCTDPHAFRNGPSEKFVAALICAIAKFVAGTTTHTVLCVRCVFRALLSKLTGVLGCTIHRTVPSVDMNDEHVLSG